MCAPAVDRYAGSTQAPPGPSGGGGGHILARPDSHCCSSSPSRPRAPTAVHRRPVPSRPVPARLCPLTAASGPRRARARFHIGQPRRRRRRLRAPPCHRRREHAPVSLWPSPSSPNTVRVVVVGTVRVVRVVVVRCACRRRSCPSRRRRRRHVLLSRRVVPVREPVAADDRSRPRGGRRHRQPALPVRRRRRPVVPLRDTVSTQSVSQTISRETKGRTDGPRLPARARVSRFRITTRFLYFLLLYFVRTCCTTGTTGTSAPLSRNRSTRPRRFFLFCFSRRFPDNRDTDLSGLTRFPLFELRARTIRDVNKSSYHTKTTCRPAQTPLGFLTVPLSLRLDIV